MDALGISQAAHGTIAPVMMILSPSVRITLTVLPAPAPPIDTQNLHRCS